MTCVDCAKHRAWADQLQSAYDEVLKQEQKLVNTVKDRERTIEKLTRELRETKDELRQRRELQGYLPQLDTPLDS